MAGQLMSGGGGEAASRCCLQASALLQQFPQGVGELVLKAIYVAAQALLRGADLVAHGVNLGAHALLRGSYFVAQIHLQRAQLFAESPHAHDSSRSHPQPEAQHLYEATTGNRWRPRQRCRESTGFSR